MRTKSQDRVWRDCAHIAEELDITSCIAEPKPMMTRSKDSRHERIKSAKHFSLMILTKEDDQNLGLRTAKTIISNRQTEIRTIRHPVNKLASIQIGTEIQTQIDSLIKAYQATLGLMDPIAGNRLSRTSTLSLKSLILNTTETFHRVTTYLHPTQFNLLMIREKM